jgi:hypothetical protein
VASTAAYLIRMSRRANEHPVSFGTSHVITVFRPLAEVAMNLPRQLTDRDGALDVQLSETPEGRGPKSPVRPVNGAVSDAEIRRALRVSRSLL